MHVPDKPSTPGQPTGAPETPQKKPYHPPTLTEHGTIQEIARTTFEGASDDNPPANYS